MAEINVEVASSIVEIMRKIKFPNLKRMMIGQLDTGMPYLLAEFSGQSEQYRFLTIPLINMLEWAIKEAMAQVVQIPIDDENSSNQ
jgi:hypothetical protein